MAQKESYNKHRNESPAKIKTNQKENQRHWLNSGTAAAEDPEKLKEFPASESLKELVN